MTTFENQWLSSPAFDPNFKFPPIVKPPETVDQVLDRIGAAGSLSDPCPQCQAKVEVDEMDGSLPKVVGITHLRGCPDFWDCEE